MALTMQLHQTKNLTYEVGSDVRHNIPESFGDLTYEDIRRLVTTIFENEQELARSGHTFESMSLKRIAELQEELYSNPLRREFLIKEIRSEKETMRINAETLTQLNSHEIVQQIRAELSI